MSETKKITKLTVRDMRKIDQAFGMVSGLSFPLKIKYRMGKIQSQLERFIKASSDAKKQVDRDAVSKFNLKKASVEVQTATGSEYIVTPEANAWIMEQWGQILDKEEEITGGIMKFTYADLQEMEDHIKEWNENIKQNDQQSVAIPNSFIYALFPIVEEASEKDLK